MMEFFKKPLYKRLFRFFYLAGDPFPACFLSLNKMIQIAEISARVAKLVDALDLGSSSGDRMGVRVSPLAPFSRPIFSSRPG